MKTIIRSQEEGDGYGGEEKDGKMSMRSLREEGRRKGDQGEQPLDTHPNSQA